MHHNSVRDSIQCTMTVQLRRMVWYAAQQRLRAHKHCPSTPPLERMVEALHLAEANQG
jgi:hypothetical protein